MTIEEFAKPRPLPCGQKQGVNKMTLNDFTTETRLILERYQELSEKIETNMRIQRGHGHFYVDNESEFRKLSKENKELRIKRASIGKPIEKFRIIGINRGESRRFSWQPSDLKMEPLDIFFSQPFLVYRAGISGDWNFSNYFDDGRHLAEGRASNCWESEYVVVNPYYLWTPQAVNLDSRRFKRALPCAS